MVGNRRDLINNSSNSTLFYASQKKNVAISDRSIAVAMNGVSSAIAYVLAGVCKCIFHFSPSCTTSTAFPLYWSVSALWGEYVSMSIQRKYAYSVVIFDLSWSWYKLQRQEVGKLIATLHVSEEDIDCKNIWLDHHWYETVKQLLIQ